MEQTSEIPKGRRVERAILPSTALGLLVIGLVTFFRMRFVEIPIEGAHEPVPIVEMQTPRMSLAELPYTIKPGDTLTNIALNFGTTVERIRIDNNLKDNNTIVEGGKLTIKFPSYLSEIPFLTKTESSRLAEIKQAIQQRYNDLEAAGLYYFSGELDSIPSLQGGIAHVYGRDPEKEKLLTATSSGAKFNPQKLECASWFFPLGTEVEITYLGPFGSRPMPAEFRKSVICKVTDRGPDRFELWPNDNVIIDLTPEVSRQLTGLSNVDKLQVQVRPFKLPDWWGQVPLPTQRPETIS